MYSHNLHYELLHHYEKVNSINQILRTWKSIYQHDQKALEEVEEFVAGFARVAVLSVLPPTLLLDTSLLFQGGRLARRQWPVTCEC